jgi:NAD-dependent deacetylase
MGKTAKDDLNQALGLIRAASHAVAFTGAGISVESGIPPFRGENGLWNRYDPESLEISFFRRNPAESWKIIAEIFYRHFDTIRPNPAHECLAWMEENGLLKAVITQNIDDLHRAAGSRTVHEFHGNFKRLACVPCGTRTAFSPGMLASLPPRCPRCGTALKPDFVFFGEPIPEEVLNASLAEIERSDLVICIGTTGAVQPAASLPALAKRHGAGIIEVNVGPSELTDSVTDLFLQSKAGVLMGKLLSLLKGN